jgi:hypothetical protein
MSLTIRNTLSSIEEVTQDLAESTEALKRHFLFRGFFQDRGFFDLDTISREAYQEGLLERDHRTAVRIWLDAAVLFERDRDGVERLTPDGRGRIDSAMSQLVQYPATAPSSSRVMPRPRARTPPSSRRTTLRPQRHAGRARGVTAAADRQRQPAIADYG